MFLYSQSWQMEIGICKGLSWPAVKLNWETAESMEDFGSLNENEPTMDSYIWLLGSYWDCLWRIRRCGHIGGVWQWSRVLGFKSPHQSQYLFLYFMNQDVSSQLLSQWHACLPVGHDGHTHRQECHKHMCKHKHISHTRNLNNSTKISKLFLLNSMVMVSLNSVH